MINIQKLKASFQVYVNQYDIKNPLVESKMIHTFGVEKMAKYICSKLQLDEEDINIAVAIAILHDFARFEQLKKYHTFIDYQSIDHGDLAVKILFEEGKIRDFIDDNQYDHIIKVAIQNHNKLSITCLEQSLSEKEILHCKIVRDADKLDNFRVKMTVPVEQSLLFHDMKDIEMSAISPKVYEQLLHCQQVVTSTIVTDVDRWLSYLAFIFDLNYPCSFIYVKENRYIDNLMNRIKYQNSDTKDKIENLRNILKEYVNEKIGEKNDKIS